MRVSDVNDNAPQFESETIVRRILENKPVRSSVQPPIRATDADLGTNAEVNTFHCMLIVQLIRRAVLS